MKIDLSSIVLAAIKHELKNATGSCSFEKWGVGLAICKSLNGDWSVWTVEKSIVRKKVYGDSRTTANACAEFVRDAACDMLKESSDAD